MWVTPHVKWVVCRKLIIWTVIVQNHCGFVVVFHTNFLKNANDHSDCHQALMIIQLMSWLHTQTKNLLRLFSICTQTHQKAELQQMTGPCVLPDEEWIDTVHYYMDDFVHGKTASDIPYFSLLPVINKRTNFRVFWFLGGILFFTLLQVLVTKHTCNHHCIFFFIDKNKCNI